MSNELVPHTEWDQKAVDLAYQYAGFTDAKSLTETEKVEALQTLVPTALQIVDEARDTIENLRVRLDDYMLVEIKSLVENNTVPLTQFEQWKRISIPELENQTPLQLIEHDRVADLLAYAERTYDVEV